MARGLTRRELLRSATLSLPTLLLTKCWYNTVSQQDHNSDANLERQKQILEQLKALEFTPNSFLTTTIFLRKLVWELIQVKKDKQPSWKSQFDESDWYNQQKFVHEALRIIKDSGTKGGRLVVAPFEFVEVDERGRLNFHWEVLDTAIDLMHEYDLHVDLAIGPVDYPYDPGIRLPLTLEQNLLTEFTDTGVNHIHISSAVDESMPKNSAAIRDFSLIFTEELVKRYGDDERVNTFHLGNEWPDNHGIEGTGLAGKTLSVSEEFMLRLIDIIKQHTDKKVTINTNIHPSEPKILRQKLGALLTALSIQGKLGFDTYPTQEEKHQTLREFIDAYETMMNAIRLEWPEIEIVFSEFQAEVWPPAHLQGKSWSYIATHHMDLILEYYQDTFLKYVQSHMIKSGIGEVSWWGAPLIVTLNVLGYIFPTQMIQTIAEEMEESI